MPRILNRNSNDPRKHSRIIADSRFGVSPKVKMSKKEFIDLSSAHYIMAEFNATNSVLAKLKEIKDLDIDVLIGELEIMATEIWNDLSRTKVGATAFNKMYVEDLSTNQPIGKFFGKSSKFHKNKNNSTQIW